MSRLWFEAVLSFPICAMQLNPWICAGQGKPKSLIIFNRKQLFGELFVKQILKNKNYGSYQTRFTG
jgi:hypothetical protein